MVVSKVRRSITGIVALVGACVFAGGAGATAATVAWSDGTHDTDATTRLLGDISSDTYVSAYVRLPDGRTLIGGSFTTLRGTAVNILVRLDADGRIDSAFNTNLGTGFALTPCQFCGTANVDEIVVQPDGKILVAGLFDSVNGTPSSRLVRLNADGSVDTAFSANLGSGFTGGGGSSAGALVMRVHLQSDGRILATGDFNSVGSAGASSVVRLNADGSVDTTYTANAALVCDMYTGDSVLMGDGRLLVTGCSIPPTTGAKTGIVLFNTDGTRNAAFDTAVGTGFETVKYDAQNQPYDTADYPWTAERTSDGGVLLGGAFTRFNGQTVPRGLLKLRADGTVDAAYNTKLGAGLALGSGTTAPTYSGAFVSDLTAQSDGRIIVNGYFDTLGGSAQKNIGRIGVDGLPDTTFAGKGDMDGIKYGIETVSLPDGSIVVHGAFDKWNGAAVDGFVVLGTAPAPAVESRVTSTAASTEAETTPAAGSAARPAIFFASMLLIAVGGLLVRRRDNAA